MDIRELVISEWVEDKIASKHGIIVAEIYEVFWNDEDPLLIRRSQRFEELMSRWEGHSPGATL